MITLGNVIQVLDIIFGLDAKVPVHQDPYAYAQLLAQEEIY